MTAPSITTKGKKLRVGQRVRLSVASDVRLGSSIVIPAGSPAEGEITDVRRVTFRNYFADTTDFVGMLQEALA